MVQIETGGREPADFLCRGTRCGATLFRPDASTLAVEPPIVVMAHGVGLPRWAGLPAVAARLTERGLAVLTFDYRSLGESDGEPRNVVRPQAQVDDWRAAVSHARTLQGVDSGRVGVWGFSLGGGGAFAAASREAVDAYVGRNPILDGARTVRYIARQMGTGYRLRTAVAGVRDLVREWTARDPYYIPIWGHYPEDLPALPTPGSKAGHEALLGPVAGDPAVNRCGARVVGKLRQYHPLSRAWQVDCPALLVEGARDRIVPSSAIGAAATARPEVKWATYDVDHFGGFVRQPFEEIVGEEADFLARHLIVTG